MTLKAIFFDFGGTIDLYPFVKERAERALNKMLDILMDSGIDLRRIYSVWEFHFLIEEKLASYKKWRAGTLIELSGEEVWKKFILKDVPGIGNLNSEKAEELFYLIEAGMRERSARSEMKEVMEILSATNLHLGIISNVISLHQVPRNLEEYGLGKYFETVVLSAEYGKSKPDPSIFHYAAEKISVKPEECMYVGNSLLKDVYGAQKAGYGMTVQIEYPDNSDEDYSIDAVPDYYIHSMKELPEIVNSLIAQAV